MIRLVDRFAACCRPPRAAAETVRGKLTVPMGEPSVSRKMLNAGSAKPSQVVTVKIDHESDDPVVEQFGLIGKGNRAHVRCKRVAQSTRSRKHGANSTDPESVRPCDFEPEILRQQLWKVVAGLEEEALELGGGSKGNRFASLAASWRTM